MKKILIGTTNPSKVKRFESLLEGYDVSFYTLTDLNIVDEPKETGKTPEENAKIKASFYGNYFDAVICNDSGLFFDCLPLDDERQPGLNIRSPKGKRLNDDEMIEYYSTLVRSLGRKVLAYYIDGEAVYHKGNVSSFMETGEINMLYAFYMIDDPSAKRHEGWPLDSLSIDRKTGKYFVDDKIAYEDSDKDNIIKDEYRKRLKQFLVNSLKIECVTK